jgi:hypothetical protein
MWTGLGIATVVACILALPVTLGFASSNPYPVGRAYLAQTGSSGVSGEAVILRQLTAGTTHVAVRGEGLNPSTTPAWQIETGAYCGTPSTAVLLTQNTSSRRSTSLGTTMTAETYTVTLAVGTYTTMMTVRLYDQITGTTPGTELACGQVIDQPDLGSQHWW